MAYVRHLIAGRKEVSAEMAARLERAASKMPETVPPLRRWDVCETCRKCPWRVGE